jgi:hypothetical protein
VIMATQSESSGLRTPETVTLRNASSGSPAGADVDGQVGARVPARVQLPPVHRPELRLPRVALVQRHRLDRRQRR